MKRYLMALLALVIITMTSSTVNAGSPQQCWHTLDTALKKIGMNFQSLNTHGNVVKFKEHYAKEWGTFVSACSSGSNEQCKICECGNPETDYCSLICGCCWGDTKCADIKP